MLYLYCFLPLVVLAVLFDSVWAEEWQMKAITSYQARVETYAPIWNEDHKMFVSGVDGDFTFQERYEATLDSVTTSSVEGALMYLQRDCIDIGATPWEENGGCQRKNNVSYITFLEIQIIQPKAALAEYQSVRYIYPEFCPFVTMEDGTCIYKDQDTGNVTRNPPECKQYNGLDGQPDIGPCVGAEAFSADMVAPYIDTVWFSYPGSCVMSTWAEGKSKTCRKKYPGGLCSVGEKPDGISCTFSYKILGYLSIDELVGIGSNTQDTGDSSFSSSLDDVVVSDDDDGKLAEYVNFEDFCEAKNVEFHSYDTDKTLGLKNVTSISFWENPSMASANVERTLAMIELYNSKVDPDSNHMEKLPMDLDNVTQANPPCYENSLECSNARFGCVRHSYAQVCSVCREQGVNCVMKVPGYTFPTLEKAARTVSDSELRSSVIYYGSVVSSSSSSSSTTDTMTTTTASSSSSICCGSVNMMVLLVVTVFVLIVA